MIAYLDTSALVKLAKTERESAALAEWLTERPTRLVTSVIGGIELARVGVILGEPATSAVSMVHAHCHLVPLDAGIADIAARLPPAVMRSLDAIHVATALALGGDIDAFVTYDERMADAARAAGLEPLAPGR